MILNNTRQLIGSPCQWEVGPVMSWPSGFQHQEWADVPGQGPRAALLCQFSKEARNQDFYVKLPNFNILAQMPLKPMASQNGCTCSSVWPEGHQLKTSFNHPFIVPSEAESWQTFPVNSLIVNILGFAGQIVSRQP